MFESNNFQPAWEQFAGKSDFATLNSADSVEFIKHLMSMSETDRKNLSKKSVSKHRH